jgi:hypothetical protein
MPDDSGWAVTLAAVAGAIATAVARVLIARLRRAPTKSEEHIMCRNHSHLTGTLIRAANQGEYTEVEMLVEQPVTLELLNGGTLTLPPYTVCLLRQEHPGAYLGKPLPPMEGPGVSVLSRGEPQSTSGHTILAK